MASHGSHRDESQPNRVGQAWNVVPGLGFRNWSLGFRVGVQGLGFRVEGFRVEGFRVCVLLKEGKTRWMLTYSWG